MTDRGWLGLAVLLFLLAVGQYILITDEPIEEVYVASLMMTAPVAFVRRWPVPAAVLASIAALVTIGNEEYVFLAADAAGMWIVFAVAAQRCGLWLSFVVATPFLINALSPFDEYDSDAEGLLALVGVVSAFVVGEVWRDRARLVEERDASVAAHAASMREQSLLAERSRTARDMHDIVAHHISAIAIQAETARLTTEGLCEQGAERFAAIGDSARAALDEMRRLLGVMRAPVESAEFEPQPGLAQLHTLIDHHRTLGGTAGFSVRGSVVSLPEAVELVAYRVVQEGLTNARRHAAGSVVETSLDYTPTLLRVIVRDHGPGAPTPTNSGYGLVGMRERVEAVGGTLTTGTHHDGGFEIVADLPTEARS